MKPRKMRERVRFMFECNKPGKNYYNKNNKNHNNKNIILLRALRDRFDKMYNNLISRIMTLEL